MAGGRVKILKFFGPCSPEYLKALVFTSLPYKSFENTVGKGEIAHNEQFLLYPSVFYPSEELSAIFIKFEIVVCKLFQFGIVLNLSFGKGLKRLNLAGLVKKIMMREIMMREIMMEVIYDCTCCKELVYGEKNFIKCSIRKINTEKKKMFGCPRCTVLTRYYYWNKLT